MVYNEGWYCYFTTDMVNWSNRGAALSLKTFEWCNKEAWAGQCIFRDGKFYWYAPVNQSNGKRMAIGMAVSDRPEGLLKDALGKPMISAFNRNRYAILQPLKSPDHGHMVVL
ncbi:MAG: family 43 glycosylhydrolase [Massilibacteroides sp.]|nr:family 43 glycosylhydrolase [Massilibacteroides sp.]